MYPNYTKAFLNLEGVFIKKVVHLILTDASNSTISVH